MDLVSRVTLLLLLSYKKGEDERVINELSGSTAEVPLDIRRIWGHVHSPLPCFFRQNDRGPFLLQILSIFGIPRVFFCPENKKRFLGWGEEGCGEKFWEIKNSEFSGPKNEFIFRTIFIYFQVKSCFIAANYIVPGLHYSQQ